MTSDQDARPQHAGEAPPVPPPPDTRYPVRHRRRLPWLIAVLVVLLLASAVTITLVIRENRNQAGKPSGQPPASASGASSPAGTSPASSGSASPSGSTSPSGSASPTQAVPGLLPQGKEAPASAIPWSQVNAGWNLAGWSSQANPNQGPSVPSTLYLVNPIGGRYRITTIPPNSSPVLWSPDLRRATVSSFNNANQSLGEYDLSTGRLLSSFGLGSRTVISYAGPAGHSLLLNDSGASGQPARLELVSTTGVHQNYLPGSTPTAGAFDRPALYFSGGSTFLIGSGHGFAVISNSGAVIRQLSLPTGTGYCQLDHWWTTGVALATCTGSADGSVQNLFRIPVDGRTPTAITQAPPPQYGYSDGWQFSGGIVAGVATSCGPGGFELIDSAGHVRQQRYPLPPGVSGQAGAVGVYGDQVSMVTGNCGTGSRSLFRVNLRAGNSSALLGPGLNGGSVTSVVNAGGR